MQRVVCSKSQLPGESSLLAWPAYCIYNMYLLLQQPAFCFAGKWRSRLQNIPGGCFFAFVGSFSSGRTTKRNYNYQESHKNLFPASLRGCRLHQQICLLWRDCRKSFLQSQESGDRWQESIKTKSYGIGLFLNSLFPDFLQVHPLRLYCNLDFSMARASNTAL